MKKHILLVDDDEDEVADFTGALDMGHIPYKCTWAKSGEQALSQLTFLTPDIIFLDIVMPGMNGLECLEAIKRTPRLEGIPVIMHSTVMTSEFSVRAMELGACACIAKPDTVTGLAELLERVMGEAVG